LRAHPHARHPRVTIRINEVNIPRDEHVLVIRAARCQDENAQKSDFDDAEDSANHSTIPNAGWAIRNSKFRSMSLKNWTLDVGCWMFARQRAMGL
jgi:hypothetical protein